LLYQRAIGRKFLQRILFFSFILDLVRLTCSYFSDDIPLIPDEPEDSDEDNEEGEEKGDEGGEVAGHGNNNNLEGVQAAEEDSDSAERDENDSESDRSNGEDDEEHAVDSPCDAYAHSGLDRDGVVVRMGPGPGDSEVMVDSDVVDSELPLNDSVSSCSLKSVRM
jgi:hypothetical protein